MTVLVVMGVSGSGKTTVARMLAGRTGWPFAEGDDLHPASNIAKMSRGQALTDADRWPWLASIAEWIDARIDDGTGAVVACSALKRSYRDVLRRPGVLFVLLDADRATLAHRVAGRHGHFMPVELLDSQLADLERPGADECAIVIDATAGPSAAADEVQRYLQTR